MKYLSLIIFFLFLGAGCPQLPPQLEEAAIEEKMMPEEKTMEKSDVPNDGLDAALEELDIVDTESSGGWGAY